MKNNRLFGSRWVHCFLVSTVLALGIVPIRSQESAGPTPYPDPANSADWPGKGRVRVYKWMTDNRKYFWTRRGQDQNTIVFAGDSLTGNWKPEEMNKAFDKLPIANRGIGGDTSGGLLFRFKEDVLDLHPKAIVLLIGTNDLSARSKVEDILFNITALIELAHKEATSTPIVLCTAPPRESPQAPIELAQLQSLNDGIRKLAQGQQGVTLLDLFPLLAQADNTPDPRYFREDKLHLGPEGYAKWSEALKPVFLKLKVD
jgi:lysophospholipase L1-like esterase